MTEYNIILKNCFIVKSNHHQAYKKLFDSILNIVSPDERVIGTCATSVVGVNAGINIFRVHDVWQNKQAIDVAYEIKKLNR